VVFRNHASSIAASIFLSYPDIIASPTRININPNIFLNIPFGSLAHLSFLINFCPKIAIARSITASQSVYEISARNPNTNPAGRTIASISA